MPAFKLQALKDRYLQLAPREQKAVLYGGIFVVVFIVYQFILTPLNGMVESERKQIKSQQTLLSWMQVTDKNIQGVSHSEKTQAKIVTPVTLMSSLQMQVKHDGLAAKMTELKQTSGDSVTMRFKKVDFDSLMKLVMLVLEKEKVMITQFSATAANAQGIVDASVVFKTA